jgi:hypothetical protein
MNVKFLFGFLLAAVLTSSLVSCDEPFDPSDPCDVPQVATVKDMTGLDGCGLMLVIVSEKASVIEPVGFDLAAKGFKDGDLVAVGLKPVQTASTCMAGKPAEILCIDKFVVKVQ